MKKEHKFTKITSKDLFETPQELIEAMFSQYRGAYDEYKRTGNTKMLDQAIAVVMDFSHFWNYCETLAALQEINPLAFNFIRAMHNSIMLMKNSESSFSVHHSEFEKFRDIIDMKR